jgi:hypothetical protein
MTFYLVEGVLFAALLVTSLSVLQMYREIRRLRKDQVTFLTSMAEANRMFEALEGTFQRVRDDGLQTAVRLEAGIEAGRALVEQIEACRGQGTGPSGAAHTARSGGR